MFRYLPHQLPPKILALKIRVDDYVRNDSSREVIGQYPGTGDKGARRHCFSGSRAEKKRNPFSMHSIMHIFHFNFKQTENPREAGIRKDR